MKKIKQSETAGYGYRVDFLIMERVSISRYELIRVNNKTVHFRDEFRDEFRDNREPKESRGHKWFASYEQAQAFALKLIGERIKELQAQVNKLDKYEKALVANRCVLVKQNLTVLSGPLRL